MRPEDDPEQRIRELERPLTEVARASELGTSEQASGYQLPGTSQNPYGANPFPTYDASYTEHGHSGTNYSGTNYSGTNYSGTSYGGLPHYSGEPASRHLGMRIGWIVFGLLVIGLSAAGVFIGLNKTSSTAPSAGPNMSGGGGPFTSRTAAVQPTPTIDEPTPVVPEAPAEPPQTGASITVSGIGSAKTVICNDSTVSISGVDNMVTITGHCTRVDVSGVENVVTIESADSIGASGMNNRIRFLSGDPNIDQSGFDNTVERG